MTSDQAATERRVTARNPSSDSENRIHADDVARRHGFRGGLVPGVTVYGYLADLLASTLGPSWVSGGGADVRFRRPCYDGEDLVLRLVPPAAGSGGSGPWGAEVLTGDGVAVTGSAWAGGGGGGGPLPAGPVPDGPRRPAGERPVVGREQLAPGTVLGSIPLDTSAETAAAYRERIGATPGVLDERGWVHPGMLLDAANRVLMAHVVMPLWLHVGSVIGHRRAVQVGEPVQVRARVAREWEQKGHRFVTLDVAWCGADPADVAAVASHTAIWSLAD
ncbi:MAG TPA: hypothetical protein VFN68_06900 [Acidimicrobiales bacterium]|nr:hypothetical protein [Acidimicrobiales bacterium]